MNRHGWLVLGHISSTCSNFVAGGRNSDTDALAVTFLHKYENNFTGLLLIDLTNYEQFNNSPLGRL